MTSHINPVRSALNIVLPPAVLQKHASPDRSERYVHVNSNEVIALMQREGYTVEKVQVTKTRSADPLYARHMVDFRHPAMNRHAQAKRVQGTVSRLLFINAHDGSTSAKLRLGVYRLVCSNGMVAERDEFAASIRHTGDAAAEVIKRAQELARNTKPMFDAIERWGAIELSAKRARNFARLAAMLRWGDPFRFKPAVLLAVRREEDDHGDLWSVFNRVQENAVLGGLKGLSPSGRAATSRPLSEIASSNEFNSQLWRLAEDFAK